MAAGARAKRAEANEDLRYRILTFVNSRQSGVGRDNKEEEAENGVNENLICSSAQSHIFLHIIDFLTGEGTRT